ncbi:MAG: hypothetical protein GX945_10765 [Lentisphaerae bacterium]|jgi:hypothetical protein|nr:hypothetical protein [Lentisphaerota bacterium]
MIEPKCPACSTALSLPLGASAEPATRCPRCKRELRYRLYPAALRRAAPVEPGSRRVLAEDSSCFFHAEKAAEAVCEQCGRFLCALCAVDFAGKCLCANCIAAQNGDAGQGRRVTRLRYDLIASACFWVGLLTCWGILPGALTALVISLWAFRKECSLVRSCRGVMLAQVFLSIAVLIGVSFMLVFFMDS